MTFEEFYKAFQVIFGRFLAVLVVRNVITQKDVDFINCKINEDEWKGGE